VVDCAIEIPAAATFWKEKFNHRDGVCCLLLGLIYLINFFLFAQELYEYVEWSYFVNILQENIGDHGDEFFEHLRSLLGRKRRIRRERILIDSFLPVEYIKEGGREQECVTMVRFDKVVKWFGPFFLNDHAFLINEVAIYYFIYIIFILFIYYSAKLPYGKTVCYSLLVSLLLSHSLSLSLSLLISLSLSLSCFTLSSLPHLLISWFHGDVTRDSANSCISGQPCGTFLIQVSYTDPLNMPFTLTFPNQNFRINRTTHGLVFQNEVYQSLEELVERNHSTLSIPCPWRYTVHA
jgi:SH2 domain